MNLSRLLPIVLLVLPACVSHAPRIQMPISTEPSCEKRAVKQTAIAAIVASTDDRVIARAYPGDAALRTVVHSAGGVFAYWHDQPLLLPDTAKALGVDGTYLTLKRAVITNEIDHDKRTRPVWFTFATPKGDRTVLELAYDVQDVCIEGQRLP